VDPELAAWIEKWVPKEAFLQGRLLFENPDVTNDRRATFRLNTVGELNPGQGLPGETPRTVPPRAGHPGR
jgi:hypothetical protein